MLCDFCLWAPFTAELTMGLTTLRFEVGVDSGDPSSTLLTLALSQASSIIFVAGGLRVGDGIMTILMKSIPSLLILRRANGLSGNCPPRQKAMMFRGYIGNGTFKAIIS